MRVEEDSKEVEVEMKMYLDEEVSFLMSNC